MWRVHAVLALPAAGAPAWSESPKVLDLTIADRKVAGTERTLRVAEGTRVELRWHADEAVELHLHGYEIVIQVPAGGAASMVFKADATGRFPLVHHGFGGNMGRQHSHRPILYLEVHPQ